MGSDDIRTLRVLYDAYDALGRAEQLAEIAPRLAEVDPDFGAPKLLEQAGQLWNAGQAEKAVQLSRLALSMDSSLGRAYYYIGLHHFSNGENAEAKTALQKFVDMAPEDSEAATAKEMMTYIEWTPLTLASPPRGEGIRVWSSTCVRRPADHEVSRHDRRFTSDQIQDRHADPLFSRAEQQLVGVHQRFFLCRVHVLVGEAQADRRAVDLRLLTVLSHGADVEA